MSKAPSFFEFFQKRKGLIWIPALSIFVGSYFGFCSPKAPFFGKSFQTKFNKGDPYHSLSFSSNSSEKHYFYSKEGEVLAECERNNSVLNGSVLLEGIYDINNKQLYYSRGWWGETGDIYKAKIIDNKVVSAEVIISGSLLEIKEIILPEKMGGNIVMNEAKSESIAFDYSSYVKFEPRQWKINSWFPSPRMD